MRQSIDAIEAEMRPPPEAFNFQRAFAMDTMAYSQWLQFVFIPRVRSLLENGGPWPSSSHAGAQAVREFDGVSEAVDLTTLLSQFDALFNAA